MKIRSIKPEFFTDSKVTRLPFAARVLFAGLWCYVDDYGRGPWLPKAIEGAVFPSDDVDIRSLLCDLEDTGLIVRYEVDDEVYFRIPSWEDHQAPKYRAKTSIPESGTDLEPIRGNPGPKPASLWDDPEKTPVDKGLGNPGEIGTNPGRIAPEFGKGEVEERRGRREGEGVSAQAPKPRNEVWDALTDLFGDPETETERSLRGKITRSLSKAGAKALEIQRRASMWPLHFGDATLTPAALEKHWSALGRPPVKANPGQVSQLEAEQERRQRRQQIIGGDE